MHYIHSDQVHTYIVSTVADFREKLNPTPRRVVAAVTMRDVVASRAPRAPSIRDVFAS